MQSFKTTSVLSNSKSNKSLGKYSTAFSTAHTRSEAKRLCLLEINESEKKAEDIFYNNLEKVNEREIFNNIQNEMIRQDKYKKYLEKQEAASNKKLIMEEAKQKQTEERK